MRSVQISLPVQNKMRNFVNNADITMARVSEEMRWRMVTLSEDAGWSYKKIAEHFGRSKSTVRDQIKRFKETGSVKDRPRIGRPTVLDEEDEETQVWSGIKKGPPRRLKFPSELDIIGAVMSHLNDLD